MHRRDAPILWHESTARTPDGDGFWSVATHAETLMVMHDAVTYSSELGANLARLELRTALEETLDRFESLELAAQPEWTRSNKHTGLRHLPLRFDLDPARFPTRSPT